MIKMLRPDQIWQPKLGAPRRNTNARKHGKRDAHARALRSRIARVRKLAKALILQANEEVKRKKEAHQ
jgi:hypothetical protein